MPNETNRLNHDSCGGSEAVSRESRALAGSLEGGTPSLQRPTSLYRASLGAGREAGVVRGDVFYVLVGEVRDEGLHGGFDSFAVAEGADLLG